LLPTFLGLLLAVTGNSSSPLNSKMSPSGLSLFGFLEYVLLSLFFSPDVCIDGDSLVPAVFDLFTFDGEVVFA